MKNYAKLFKLIMLVLIVLSVAVFLTGWIAGFEAGKGWPVDLLFYWTYVMLAIAGIAIVCVGGYISAKSDASFLKKMLFVIGGTVALVAVVYLLSPGKPAMGMLEQPSAATLKLTDTILNLTYILAAGAILAIIGGEVYNSVMGKKEKAN